MKRKAWSLALSAVLGASVFAGIPTTTAAAAAATDPIPEGAVVDEFDGATLTPGGQATMELDRVLSVGAHELTVAYAGDARQAPATAPLTLVVRPA
ncbi:Ig-like domain repeat protein [Microtetraspora fusca]|uniref:Ig-like domain repeat protein n=1 Tax=Microtetraspora fusca TaxID=1997 RepID=UPI00082DAE2F|nr:Ig-like domain repeat protein [Microtetraspora fusca]